MRTLVAFGLIIAMHAIRAQDTVDVPVGSSLINWKLERPYRSQFHVWQVTGHDSTLLADGSNTITHRDTAGMSQMLMYSDANERGPDGKMAHGTDTMTFDLHTLAFRGPPASPRSASAFFGPTADVVVEFLPRRPGVVYRLRLWFPGASSDETHLYETRGHDHDVWMVEDRQASTGKVASRLWLVDRPPYMLRWTFYDAPASGNEIHASQGAMPAQ